MTTPEQLKKAREWAKGYEEVEMIKSVEKKSAAEIIASLPDSWIDAEKVRELSEDMSNWRIPRDRPSTIEDDYRELMIIVDGFTDRINALLHAPPFEVVWGEFKWHEAFGKVQIASRYASDSDEVLIVYEDSSSPTGTTHSYVIVSELSDLPEGLPEEAQAVMAESIEEFKRGEFVDIDFGETETSPIVELPTAGGAWIVEWSGETCYAVLEDSDTAPWCVIVSDGEHIWAGDNEVTRIAQLVPRDTK